MIQSCRLSKSICSHSKERMFKNGVYLKKEKKTTMLTSASWTQEIENGAGPWHKASDEINKYNILPNLWETKCHISLETETQEKPVYTPDTSDHETDSQKTFHKLSLKWIQCHKRIRKTLWSYPACPTIDWFKDHHQCSSTANSMFN